MKFVCQGWYDWNEFCIAGRVAFTSYERALSIGFGPIGFIIGWIIMGE